MNDAQWCERMAKAIIEAEDGSGDRPLNDIADKYGFDRVEFAYNYIMWYCHQHKDYSDAVGTYLQWASQFPGQPNQPNEGMSERVHRGWQLANVNGPLAMVYDDGRVVQA